MIHIATVHWKTDRWIPIQLRYLKRNITSPYRIYSFLSGSATAYRDSFYFASCAPLKDHATKLNLLADIILNKAQSDNDPLIFIDGDAFPIAPTDEFIRNTLTEYPLAAIQRIENVGDIQPHPSFCLTTVGFWKEIRGNWQAGFQWRNFKNEVRTDVGGELLRILNENQITWKKLLRTDQLSDHELLFGVYHKLIYHHGSGFRNPVSMIDRIKSLNGTVKSKQGALLLDRILNNVSLKNRFRIHHALGINRKIEIKNQKLSEEIFRKIESGIFFK